MFFVLTYFKRIVLTTARILITPKSSYWDDARREFTLNILLVGSIILAAVGFLSKLIRLLVSPASFDGLQPQIVFLFLLFLCFLLLLSRIGKVKAAAFLLVCFLFLSALYTNLQWGVESGSGLLIHALVIIMAGILLGTRSSFFITLTAVISLTAIFYLHHYALIKPDLMWKHISPEIGKILIYEITLSLIAIIVWLSNREITKALKRAKRSEAALRKQRDQLEIIVEKRTKELRKIQAEKLAQLYRFAEFGRLSSGLFHDLVNPLNVISLNLKQLSDKSHHPKIEELSEIEVILERAINGTRQMEKFIGAARQQMKNQEALQIFSIQHEIAQTIQMLEHKAKMAQVTIQFTADKEIKLLGNPIKFDQVILNIIANAIDAYEKTRRKTKIVEVRLQKDKKTALIRVQDFGSGISKKNISQIFEPLFTTKSFEKGTGIGLSISKHIVEKEFKGKIQVTSKEGTGTLFTIEIPTTRPSTRLLRTSKS